MDEKPIPLFQSVTRDYLPNGGALRPILRGPEAAFSITYLDDTVSEHRVGNLDETGYVGAGQVVDLAAARRAVFRAIVVEIGRAHV